MKAKLDLLLDNVLDGLILEADQFFFIRSAMIEVITKFEESIRP